MTCEILAVGTELLLGHTVNTNASELGLRLAALGVDVLWHSVVGDNPGRLREAAIRAKTRADLVLCTGGLGPTYDDLTKNVLAECFGKRLVFCEEEAAFLRSFYEKRNRSMTPNVMQQAWLPEGSVIFHNDWGTAPGCAFEADGTRAILLPGPPYECLPMFDACAAPYLRALTGETLVSRQIKVFGLGESAVEQIFRAEMETMKNPSLATYAKEGEVMLRVTAKAKTEAEAAALCEPVVRRVTDALGAHVYGVDVDSLEALVLALLKERGLTFATAESLTGGLIGARFTALSGASAVFRGGALTYCDEVKAAMLGVPAELLAEKGAVSREVAAAMAEGARQAAGADLAVSATGLAGPDGDGVNPVGTVFVGLAGPDGTWVRHLTLGAGRGRNLVRALSASHAFDMLRRYLTGLPIE